MDQEKLKNIPIKNYQNKSREYRKVTKNKWNSNLS